LEGAGWEHENQRKSDIQLSEARTLIRDARDKMEAADRDKVARHLEKAVKELDTALAIK
jgi:ribosomal protein S20